MAEVFIGNKKEMQFGKDRRKKKGLSLATNKKWKEKGNERIRNGMRWSGMESAKE